MRHAASTLLLRRCAPAFGPIGLKARAAGAASALSRTAASAAAFSGNGAPEPQKKVSAGKSQNEKYCDSLHDMFLSGPQRPGTCMVLRPNPGKGGRCGRSATDKIYYK